MVNADTSGITLITNNGTTRNFFNGTSAGSADRHHQNLTLNDTSAAADAGIATYSGGSVDFSDGSKAGSYDTQHASGLVTFNDTSEAGDAAITNSAGTDLQQQQAGTAESATTATLPSTTTAPPTGQPYPIRVAR